MKVKELKKQTEWMPDDYDVVIIPIDKTMAMNVKREISFQVDHDKKTIEIYAQ
jgi:hypothetical protein